MPWAQIGRRVGRHPATVKREVEANCGRSAYRPAIAERRAEQLRCRLRPRRLEVAGELRERVIRELELGRSPVAIWTDLVAQGSAVRVCVETIYAAIYAGVLGVRPSECLRARRPCRRRRQVRCESKRPGLPNISSRPAVVNDRGEIGRWEGAQIIEANNHSSMLWLTERVTRYSIGVTMPEGYAGEAIVAGLICGLDQVPPHLLRSITFDQSSEWGYWPILASRNGIDIWFCDPHSPWQRGQVENLNRQWRFWFPRGTDLGVVEQARADHVASIVNGQRRRSFGYESPAERYAAAVVQ